jgi:subtilisin family serine protease
MSGTSMATPHVAGAIALCKGEAGGPAGACGVTETSPATLIPKLRSTTASYGFTGDPNAPVASSRYFGYLLTTSP